MQLGEHERIRAVWQKLPEHGTARLPGVFRGTATRERFPAVRRSREPAVVLNMWNEVGFVWYERGRRATNRIDYMRWTQAWMYCALGELLRAIEGAG